jgi:hypothetical protein
MLLLEVELLLIVVEVLVLDQVEVAEVLTLDQVEVEAIMKKFGIQIGILILKNIGISQTRGIKEIVPIIIGFFILVILLQMERILPAMPFII